MQQLISFAFHHRSLVLFGISLTFFSSFGQTFLISLYIPEIEATFGLSNTGLSSLYAVATMSSAFALPWVGRLVDYWPLRKFTLMVLFGYATACLILSFSFHPLIVLLGFFGLRFFGQGLMGHTSVSTMARAFEKDRGKAISLATLGHPMSEAALPLLVAFGIAVLGWRSTLQMSALTLIILVVPLVLWILQTQPASILFPAGDTVKSGEKPRNPLKIMRLRAFWIIAPAVLMLGFLNTAIFFFQIKLGHSRSWETAWVAGSISVYAAANALALLVSGPVVDRLSARKLYPFMLVPYTIGLLILAVWHHPMSYPVALALIGLANGAGSTIRNAVYAEVFGVQQIGTVRSLFAMVMVFSTALGPLTFGLLLDAGWTFSGVFALSSFLLLVTILWSLNIRYQPKSTTSSEH